MNNYHFDNKQDKIAKVQSQLVNKTTCTLGILVSAKRYSNGFALARVNSVLKEKFAAACKYGIKMFVFDPDNISWDDNTINGSVYKLHNGNKGYWITKTFSFPDVIYNRIHNRSYESKPKVVNLLTKLENNPDVQFFNSRYLDKWEVYNTLQHDHTTSAIVPFTRLLTFSNLSHILSITNEAFIKPRNNNASRGIIKVIRKSSESYIYSKASSAKPVWSRNCSLKGLWNQITKTVGTANDYLVQAGIDLFKKNDQVVDLRAQIQKNGRGEWVLTGMEGRVAQKSSFVTTGINYGKIISINKVIEATSPRFAQHRQSFDSQIEYIMAKIPKSLERNLGLSLAVLSIDIGLDTNGKLWIIEVSSKPEPFRQRNIRILHYKYLMEYILYITR